MDLFGSKSFRERKIIVKKMKNLLEYLLSEILGGSDFKIEEVVGDNGFIDLKVTTDPKNMGIIIGKKGKMIKALRTLLKTKATLDRVGFSLEVAEKETPAKES